MKLVYCDLISIQQSFISIILELYTFIMNNKNPVLIKCDISIKQYKHYNVVQILKSDMAGTSSNGLLVNLVPTFCGRLV